MALVSATEAADEPTEISVLVEGETSSALESQAEIAAPLVLILVGRVGAGKSSTANSLLGPERGAPFLARRAATAVTRTCHAEEVADGFAELDVGANGDTVDGDAAPASHRLLVLDTPGLGDAASEEDTYTEIRRGLSELVPAGAKVCLLLVLSLASRVGEDELAVVANLRHHIFGHGMMQCTMVVWTHGDLLDDGAEINDYLKDLEPRVRELLDELGGGHVMVTNRNTAGTTAQVQNLLSRARSVATGLPTARADAGKRVAGRKSARRHRQMEAGLLSRQHHAKLEAALSKKDNPPGPKDPKESSCIVL